MRSVFLLTFYLAASASAQDIQKMKVEEIYGRFCSSCHGAKFEGGLGGSLVDGVWKRGGTDADIT